MPIAANALAFVLPICASLAVFQPASPQAETPQAPKAETAASILRSSRGTRLAASITRLVVKTPSLVAEVVAAVNLLLAGARSPEERRALAESAALGFVRAQRILTASGRQAEAAAVAAAVAAEGDPVLVEAVNGVGSIPPAYAEGGGPVFLLAPEAFGGGAGGAPVSPSRP